MGPWATCLTPRSPLPPSAGYKQGCGSWERVAGGAPLAAVVHWASPGCPLALRAAAEGLGNCLEKDQECPAVWGAGQSGGWGVGRWLATVLHLLLPVFRGRSARSGLEGPLSPPFLLTGWSLKFFGTGSGPHVSDFQHGPIEREKGKTAGECVLRDRGQSSQPSPASEAVRI